MSCSSTSTFGKRLLRCLLEEDDRKVDTYRARSVTTEDEIVGKTVVVEGETMETNCTAMETTMQGEDFLHAVQLIGGRSETTGVTSVETYDHLSERNKEDEKMSDDEDKEETSTMTYEGGPGVSRNCEANESHEEGQEEEIQTQTEVLNAENTGGDEEGQEKDDVDDDESLDSSEDEEDVEGKGNDSDFNPDSEEVEEEPEDEVEEESEDNEKEEDESEREGDQASGISDEDDRPSKRRKFSFPKDRNGNESKEGKIVNQKHNLQRAMAAQGLFCNRDVSALTTMISTSPRLKKILDDRLAKWKPSLPLLVRSKRSKIGGDA